MDRRPPHTGFDTLRLPLVGPLLRWRWGRLALQLPLALAALLLIVDGFTGPPVAARNLATVAPWVHYRGLVVITLLLAGNLFCMGCPFTLPRTLARRLSLRGRRFPRALRGKWLAGASLITLFFLYEWLDLWASPALTAWVIVAYFAASFALEAAFTESAFCKYICPLGTFNFVHSTISPTQITVRDTAVCAACQGKECVNGSWAPQPAIRVDHIPVAGGAVEARPARRGPGGVLGCGTLLYPPQLKSNLDCVYCLDCVRACPHDNIGLLARAPGRELNQPGAWPARWDVSLLAIGLAFLGALNAFGMVPPVYELQRALAAALGARSDFITLLLIFAVGALLLPAALTLAAARLAQALTRTTRQRSLRRTVAAFAPAFVPLGFGIWFAHYSFHFLIAPLTLIPVIQEFLGQPGDWARFGGGLDSGLIAIIQAAALLGGFVWSLSLAQNAALRLYRRRALAGLLPWALLLAALLLFALYLFSLPMEARGAALSG